jgi:hypothetical protein
VASTRDERRDRFRQAVALLVAGNVTLIGWLATAEREPIPSLFVWWLGCMVGGTGWTLLVERRVPRPFPIRRQGMRLDVDGWIGAIGVLLIAAVSWSWQVWLPSLRDGPLLRWQFPESIEALRSGLGLILGTSLTVAIWIAMRLAFPQTSPSSERALVNHAP